MPLQKQSQFAITLAAAVAENMTKEARRSMWNPRTWMEGATAETPQEAGMDARAGGAGDLETQRQMQNRAGVNANQDYLAGSWGYDKAAPDEGTWGGVGRLAGNAAKAVGNAGAGLWNNTLGGLMNAGSRMGQVIGNNLDPTMQHETIANQRESALMAQLSQARHQLSRQGAQGGPQQPSQPQRPQQPRAPFGPPAAPLPPQPSSLPQPGGQPQAPQSPAVPRPAMQGGAGGDPRMEIHRRKMEEMRRASAYAKQHGQMTTGPSGQQSYSYTSRPGESSRWTNPGQSEDYYRQQEDAASQVAQSMQQYSPMGSGRGAQPTEMGIDSLLPSISSLDQGSQQSMPEQLGAGAAQAATGGMPQGRFVDDGGNDDSGYQPTSRNPEPAIGQESAPDPQYRFDMGNGQMPTPAQHMQQGVQAQRQWMANNANHQRANSVAARQQMSMGGGPRVTTAPSSYTPPSRPPQMGGGMRMNMGNRGYRGFQGFQQRQGGMGGTGGGMGGGMRMNGMGGQGGMGGMSMHAGSGM
jgi:hypothetical protein